MSAVLALLLLLPTIPSHAQEAAQQQKICPDALHPTPKSRAHQLACLVDWLAGPGKKARTAERDKQKSRARDLIAVVSSFVQRAGPDGNDVSDDAKRQSQQHYLSGIIFFQKGDYARAREEWKLSRELDSSNDDAVVGLERIKEIEGAQSLP